MIPYVHLHVHSHYSLLDGQADVTRIIDKAIADGMRGVALTDHGNSVGTALNLTQLEATTKDYAVHNARLILHPTTQPDTVNIERLDGKMLVARGRHLYRLPARK